MQPAIAFVSFSFRQTQLVEDPFDQEDADLVEARTREFADCYVIVLRCGSGRVIHWLLLRMGPP